MAAANIWLTDRVDELKMSQRGPFVRLRDGSLLSIGGDPAFRSTDEGKSWQVYARLNQQTDVFAVAVGRDGGCSCLPANGCGNSTSLPLELSGSANPLDVNGPVTVAIIHPGDDGAARSIQRYARVHLPTGSLAYPDPIGPPKELPGRTDPLRLDVLVTVIARIEPFDPNNDRSASTVEYYGRPYRRTTYRK